ncbi:MAG: BatA and WFA domain-containing protein [Thermoguttaceae bacterium]
MNSISDFINPVRWASSLGTNGLFWAALAAVPPLIVLLYFLKLKRTPLEVPSTYLWHKSIEDLHVNSIWQRLRKNLLLLLQLLLLLLVLLALLRPSWKARQLTGDRFIFLIDNSASMQATDVGPSRLEEAKRRAAERIGDMDSGDVGMVISFADRARVEQMFTDDHGRLQRSIEGIQPTSRPTSLLEALKVASGLANPGRSSQDVTDFQVAEALPATLVIYSDGRFDKVAGFSLGNLEPVFVAIGDSEARNVGIVAFNVRRSETSADQLQAFARLENFGAEDVEVDLKLFLDDHMIDADRLAVTASATRGVVFDLGVVEPGVLRLEAATGDHLSADDKAYAVVNPPRQANVLLITAGNEFLEFALQTDSSRAMALVDVKTPEFLDGKQYAAIAAGGGLDLIIYDNCAPKEMPQANTLFVGSMPPAEGWSAEEGTPFPQIFDVEAEHPLMEWTDFGDVKLAEGTALKIPAAGSPLIDSDAGPLLGVAPRERFEDVVIGFSLAVWRVGNEQGGLKGYIGWPMSQSFPVFVRNMLGYFGGDPSQAETGGFRPGSPVVLDNPSPKTELSVRLPNGKTERPRQTASGKSSFTETGDLGVYEVRSGKETVSRFAVNLFDAAESDIRTDAAPSLDIGYVEVVAQEGWEAARQETWKWLLGLGLVVLLVEWYIYNRRVSL